VSQGYMWAGDQKEGKETILDNEQGNFTALK
jgi:hypothetical protein